RGKADEIRSLPVAQYPVIVVNHPEHRIDPYDILEEGRQDVDRVDDGGEPEAELQENGDQLSDIAHEDIENAENQAEPGCKAASNDEENREPDKRPAGMIADQEIGGDYQHKEDQIVEDCRSDSDHR